VGVHPPPLTIIISLCYAYHQCLQGGYEAWVTACNDVDVWLCCPRPKGLSTGQDGRMSVDTGGWRMGASVTQRDHWMRCDGLSILSYSIPPILTNTCLCYGLPTPLPALSSHLSPCSDNTPIPCSPGFGSRHLDPQGLTQLHARVPSRPDAQLGLTYLCICDCAWDRVLLRSVSCHDTQLTWRYIRMET
jgi:hypothetical protein